MKFAIFGDIHANLEAFDAVIPDATSQGVTHHVCLGDIVGYNANPHECVARVQDLGCPVVKGNHDEEAGADNEIAGLNPLARAAMEWTRRVLTGGDKLWLRNLDLVLEVSDFTIVHATLDTPESWAYVINEFDALASFSFQRTQVCFFGHTHRPRIWVRGRAVAVENSETVFIQPGRQYLVNVGSVGQPRDGDWRAAYAIYDHDNQRICIRRVPYDLASAQMKIRDAGL